MTLDNGSLRVLERDSIRAFVQEQSEHFTGRVLDYGCGKMPYRDIIEGAGGIYTGYDREFWPANISGENVGPETPLREEWDAILTTQTIQYLAPWEVLPWFSAFRSALFVRRGTLVMTGPTTWPLVETADLCRYTPWGISSFLREAGFELVHVDVRAPIKAGSVELYCGWQAVAKARA